MNSFSPQAMEDAMAWIWENEDWPRFRWHLDDLHAPLCEVRQKLGELSGTLTALGMNTALKAALDAMSEDVVRSSEIEGVMLSAEQVRSSVAWRLGLPNEGLAARSHYIEGLVDIMIDACRNCNTSLTEARLMNWHKALMISGEAGVYRHSREPMRVISGILGNETIHYEAPPSERVPEMMHALLQWINRDDTIDPMIKAAVSSFWFVSIHPFSDGNGRISRTIADSMLARADGMKQRFYSMSSEIQKCRSEYYNILERTQCGDMDITNWILWFVRCLSRAVQTSLDEVQCVIKKAHFWEHFRDCDINARQRKVVDRLLAPFEGKLTTAKYAKLAKCSSDTALRDLQALVACGVLRCEGTGRGTHYVALLLDEQ